MPEPLTQEEVNSKTDPSVAKQWDYDTPMQEQIDDFYKTVDGLKTSLLTTIRPNIGPVSRSMQVAKRIGPDFYYLANINSQKFTDIQHDKTAQITFQNSSNQDWVTITGEVTKASSDDHKVQELYVPPVSAWFGDLGDGVHNGTADDPRMAVIEVKPKYIAYWKATTGKLGFFKEVSIGAYTGKVAQTGLHREFNENVVNDMRAKAKRVSKA